MKIFTSLLLLLLSFNTWALVIGTAQKFQMPAWIERGGVATSLNLGDDILAGDKIITGNSSRVLLHINDGSDIKIGADSSFRFQSASQPAASGIFQAELGLLSGAFRYTTNRLRPQSKRNLKIGVGVVSLGIRGTDVWGKSGSTEDTVVLIEGDVELTKPAGQPQRLNVPLMHIVSPKNLPLTNPIPVVMSDLKAWAFETELQAGKGIVQEDGRYRVHLGAFSSQSDADKLAAKLDAKGFHSQIETHSTASQQWHRVLIANLASLDDAKSVGEKISAITGRSDYWFSSSAY